MDKQIELDGFGWKDANENSMKTEMTSNDIIAGNDRERFVIELKFIEKCSFKVLVNFLTYCILRHGATWREKLMMCIHSVAGCPYTNMIK